MKMKVFLLPTVLLLSVVQVLAQPIIYNDATSLVTGFWNQNGTLQETSGNTPYEGSNHYELSYSFTGYWAGAGLNLANWGPNGYDFSGYTHLRLAYRGMNSDHRLTLTLRSDAGDGNAVTLGNSTSTYLDVEIPLFAFAAATDLNLSSITELAFSVSSDIPNGSSTLYFDDIQLVNTSTGTTTSATTQQRAASFQRGMNLNNWLEAYWLIPFNAFPETDRFEAQDIINFRNLGIDALRLPVTFEHLAGPAPNYTLDTNHEVFGLIDDAISWAASNNMKLIIDMHHGTNTLTDANYLTELPRLEAIWAQIIARYSELDPERYFFEIYNEPFDISNDNFRVVAQALVDVIRAAGADHSVIVGASGFNSAGELLSFPPLDDPDIIYTFHFYEPFAFTHQQMSWTNPPYLASRAFPIGSDETDVSNTINAAGEWRDFYNAPVIVGEFGVTNEAAAADRCNWIELIADLFADNGFAWFYWGATDISNGFGFFDGGVISEATMTPCFGTALDLSSTVLAINELSEVSINCVGNRSVLSWQLLTDEPGTQYVEGFAPATKGWETLANLSMHPQELSYSQSVPGTYTAYRVRIVELDGTVHYTAIMENTCINVADWKVYPNPTTGPITLGRQIFNQTVDLQIHNTLGQLIWIKNNVQIEENLLLDLSFLPAGIYQLRLSSRQQKTSYITQFVKH